MKKSCLLFAACAAAGLVALPAFAQDPVSLMFKGGGNMADISDADAAGDHALYDTKPLFGLVAGAGYMLYKRIRP